MEWILYLLDNKYIYLIENPFRVFFEYIRLRGYSCKLLKKSVVLFNGCIVCKINTRINV